MCLIGDISEEFVSGGPHAERERFSSPEVPLLGWMNEGVQFMLNLGMLWVREFIVRKAGMRVWIRARSSEDGRGSPWSRTTTGEVRGSTGKSHDQEYMHELIKVISVRKWVFRCFKSEIIMCQHPILSEL